MFLKLHFIGCQDDIPLKSHDNTYDAYNKYIPKCQSCADCHEKKNLIKKNTFLFFFYEEFKYFETPGWGAYEPAVSLHVHSKCIECEVTGLSTRYHWKEAIKCTYHYSWLTVFISWISMASVQVLWWDKLKTLITEAVLLCNCAHVSRSIICFLNLFSGYVTYLLKCFFFNLIFEWF